MRILFVDMHCPSPYDMHTLDEKPLGGTEATVIRVADALVAEGCDVFVTQHNRKENYEWYVTPEILMQDSWRPEHIVFLRSNLAFPFVTRKFKSAMTYSWLHDWIDAQYVREYEMLNKAGTKIICVSDSHKSIVASQIRDTFPEPPYEAIIKRIYNPVMTDYADLAGIERNPNKLVFFSSPHKGFLQVLDHFKGLRQTWPELELHIANPGYYPSTEVKHQGVVNHGSLTHEEVLKHVASSFAVLYLQKQWAETFGLVFAEANALGTPVISFNHGAAKEILGKEQVFEHADFNTAFNIIENWKRMGSPKVSKNPEFDIKEIVYQWIKLFRDNK